MKTIKTAVKLLTPKITKAKGIQAIGAIGAT
jgi:hypothetical protein